MAGLFSKPNYYAVPQQPTFDTMQKVAIPDYRIQQTFGGSHVRRDNPNTVFIDDREINAFNGNKNQVLAHEMQHQIESSTKQKGQAGSFEVDYAWLGNAKALGKDGRAYYEMLQNNLVKPQVQKRLEELGAVGANRVLDNPKKQTLRELLADLSSFETLNKKDLTEDPVLKKHLFNNDILNTLYKSTTGMAGVVIGDSDYTPYSLEASKAWNKQPQTTVEKLQGLFYKDPFGDTTK
jgi:hypothetical protein